MHVVGLLEFWNCVHHAVELRILFTVFVRLQGILWAFLLVKVRLHQCHLSTIEWRSLHFSVCKQSTIIGKWYNDVVDWIAFSFLTFSYDDCSTGKKMKLFVDSQIGDRGLEIELCLWIDWLDWFIIVVLVGLAAYA